MGVSSLKGQRTYMEDSYCMSSLTVTPFLDEDSYSVQAYLGAVFDGHRFVIHLFRYKIAINIAYPCLLEKLYFAVTFHDYECGMERSIYLNDYEFSHYIF